MPKMKTIASIFTSVENKLPEFGQEVLGSWTEQGKEKYEFVHLHSVTMTATGQVRTFQDRNNKEVKPTHWLYLVPPAKVKEKETTKEPTDGKADSK